MPTSEDYREAVRDMLDGYTVIISDQAEVQEVLGPGATTGAWVQAWVWMPADDVPDQGQFGVGA